MVKHKRLQRSVTNSTDRSSFCSAGYMENTYCVVLHIVEAINFYGREVREGEQDKIIMNAALNTVDFEVEGTSSTTSETIVFNSNCIWECDMAGIKRIKTDHRPVKVTFFSCSGGTERKTIGSLLLPVRGLPVLGSGGNNSPLQLKMFWHKLMCISNEFRSHKPEVLLMLAIIKKTLLHTNDFKHLMAFNGADKQSRAPPLKSPGHSITANMLQSQANVYVQSLVQLGLLQVGNDPLVDCDIVEVVLQLKQLRNVNNFIKSIFHGKDVDTVLLMFDFVGNVTSVDLKLNSEDNYALNDVLGLRFKSSLRSIHLYFQRIFYLPINMYVNGGTIANYRMDFGKLMPPDSYFEDKHQYKCSGSFAFERFGRMGSARELKPILDYGFSVNIQEACCRQQGKAFAHGPQEQEGQKQMGINSAGSTAVIHEVPKERSNENVVDWKRKQEEQCPSDNASVDSLDVGAELSTSDEPNSASDLHLDGVPNPETPSAAVSGSKERRKKFTRLLENDCDKEDNQEFSDDNSHSSPSKRNLKNVKCVNRQQLTDVVDFPEENESDAELLAIYNNRKFCRKLPHGDNLNVPQLDDSLQRSVEKQDIVGNSTRANSLLASKPGEKAIRSKKNETIKALSEQRSLKTVSVDNQDKMHIEHLHDDFQDEEQDFQIDTKKVVRKRIKQTPAHIFENEQKFENMSQELAKDMQKKRFVKLHTESTASRVEETILSKCCPSEKDVKKTVLTTSALNDPDETNATNTLICRPKIVRKKKTVPKTEEVELVEDTELSKSLSKFKASQQNICLVSDKSINETACAQQACPCPSQIEVIPRLRKRIVEKHCMDMENEVEHVYIPNPNSQKNRLKQLNNSGEGREISRKPLKSKRASNSDLTLGARWVVVDKVQKRALEETEKYISEICKSELDSVLSNYEVRKGSNRKKLVASSRRVQKAHAEYEDECSEITSSVDYSQLDKLRNTKIERKRVQKKTTITDLSEDQDTSEMADGMPFNLKPKGRKTRKPIQLEANHVESEPVNLDSKSNHYAATCINSEQISLEESSQSTDKYNQETCRKLVRKKSVKLALAEPVESKPSTKQFSLVQEKTQIRKKLTKTVPAMLSHGNLLSAQPKLSGEAKPDGQIAHMEVTVHMYDQSNSSFGEINKPKVKSFDEGVNTDDLGGNASFRQIVEANKQLQEEIQSLQKMCNFNQLGNQSDKEQSLADDVYQTKFRKLEQHIAQLENHLQGFESRTQEMQTQNAKLLQEKTHLKERIRHMEKQISQLHNHNQDSKGYEMKQVLSEMREQNNRFLDMSKAKDRYKKQWRRCAKRVHNMKLAMYEKNLQHEYDNMPDNVINLKRILTKDAEEFEREYGQFRRRGSTLSFAESENSSEPVLKDCLRGLSVQTIKTINNRSPENSFENTRMH